jgi:hypothetical protein
MLTCYQTFDQRQIESVLNEPRNFQATFGQDPSIKYADMDPTYKYYGVYDTHSLIGLFPVRELTKITLDTHIYIKELYQKSELVDKACYTAMRKFKEEGYEQLIGLVPFNLDRMITFIQRIGYEPRGLIQNGIMYNGEKTSVFVFQKDLICGIIPD